MLKNNSKIRKKIEIEAKLKKNKTFPLVIGLLLHFKGRRRMKERKGRSM